MQETGRVQKTSAGRHSRKVASAVLQTAFAELVEDGISRVNADLCDFAFFEYGARTMSYDCFRTQLKYNLYSVLGKDHLEHIEPTDHHGRKGTSSDARTRPRFTPPVSTQAFHFKSRTFLMSLSGTPAAAATPCSL